MPFPKLPENNTFRLFIDYTSMGVPHSLLLRANGDVPWPDLQLWANNVRDVLITRMRVADSVTGARYSPLDAIYTLPLPTLPAAGLIAGNVAWAQDPESVFLSITGRSNITGRRGRMGFFCPVATPVWPADNRYNYGENIDVDTFHDNLVDAATGLVGAITLGVAIDNGPLSFYSYTNISSHRYWQNKQRKTG